jgi:DNA-binding NarL/FixJ family response regulator
MFDLLGKTTVKLILMDVQMPELFGDQVAQTLRDGRGVKAKIVLHSSLDEEVLAELARNAGVDGWIAKSAGVGHLVDEVKRLLAAG